MRRRVVYVLVLVILFWVIFLTPWVNGILFKRQYLKDIAIINQGSDNAIVVREYNRGYMYSTATLTMAFPKSKEQIVINERISHGPFVRDPNSGIHLARALIISDVHLPIDVEKIIVGANNPNGVMQVTTIAGFGDKYTSEFHTPIFAVNKPPVRFTWQGIQGTTSSTFADNYIANLTHDLKLGEASGEFPDGKFLSKDIISKGSRDCAGLNVLCNASGELFVTQFNVLDKDGRSLNLNNLNVNYRYGSDENNHYNSTYDAKLAKLTIFNYDITSANLSFSEKNLNTEKLNKLVSTVRSQAQVAAVDPNKNKDAMNAIMLSSLGLVPEVIDANTLVTLTFNANTTDGNIRLHTLFNWPVNKPPTDYLELSQKMHSQVNIRATTTFVDHMIALIDKDNPTANVVVAPAPVVVKQTTIVTRNRSEENFKKLVVDLVMQKQITAAAGKTLTDYADQNRSTGDVIIFLNALSKANAAPPAVLIQLKDAYEKIKEEQNKMPIPPLTVAADGRRDYKGQLDILVAQATISQPTADKLLVLQEQKLDPSIYNASIDKMVSAQVINENLAGQLKKQYAEDFNPPKVTTTVTSGDTTIVTSTPAVATQPAQPAANSAKQVFNELIKKGIVVQDKDDYVLFFEYKDGMINLNQKTMTIEEFGAIVGKQ